MLYDKSMIGIVVFVMGLMAGSFIGAFTWRLKKGKDWVKGRSQCEKCSHTLAVHDLIPLLSWLSLRGKCRYCHKPIGVSAPLLELITGVLFTISYFYWPYNLTGLGVVIFIGWLVILTGLIALSLYDLRWMILPDKLILPVSIIGMVWVGLIAFTERDVTILLQSALAGGLFFSFFYVLFQVSNGKWIGGGDVKLSFFLGLLAGTPAQVFLLVFLASLLGCIVSLPLVILQGKKISTKVPFGPFLITAAFVVLLWGEQLLGWYSSFVI